MPFSHSPIHYIGIKENIISIKELLDSWQYKAAKVIFRTELNIPNYAIGTAVGLPSSDIFF